MIKPTVNYRNTIDFWRSKTAINSDIRFLLTVHEHLILDAFNSGRIENPEITWIVTRDVFTRGRVSGFTGEVRTLIEIENLKRGFEYFMNCIEEKRAIDDFLVKNIHKILTDNTYDENRLKKGERPGTWKINDFATGKNLEVGSPLENVDKEMSELLEWVRSVKSTDPEIILRSAAFFHAEFENIHPFADGNGRTGRLLMNYFLVSNNHPFIIIHEEDRQKYIHTLNCHHKNEELNPFFEFLKKQTVKTWKKSIEREHTRKQKNIHKR